MHDDDAKKETDPYAEEALRRWGHTDAYKQSQERVMHLTKTDFARIAKDNDDLLKEIVAVMDQGPASVAVQRLIARHYEGMRAFYDPTPELYRGLGQMYADDPRFAKNFTKHHPDLAVFMREAMTNHADTQENVD